MFPQAGESGWRGAPSMRAMPEEVHSASSPAGVSVEFSLLAGPEGKASGLDSLLMGDRK